MQYPLLLVTCLIFHSSCFLDLFRRNTLFKRKLQWSSFLFTKKSWQLLQRLSALYSYYLSLSRWQSIRSPLSSLKCIPLPWQYLNHLHSAHWSFLIQLRSRYGPKRFSHTSMKSSLYILPWWKSERMLPHAEMEPSISTDAIVSPAWHVYRWSLTSPSYSPRKPSQP